MINFDTMLMKIKSDIIKIGLIFQIMLTEY